MTNHEATELASDAMMHFYDGVSTKDLVFGNLWKVGWTNNRNLSDSIYPSVSEILLYGENDKEQANQDLITYLLAVKL